MVENEGLKEKYQHGTRDFPIMVHHSPGLIAPYHWHDEYEFLYMNSGSAFLRIGTEVIHLEAGQCVFINKGTLHSLYTEGINNFDFCAIVFDSSLIFGEIDICNKYMSSKYVIKSKFTTDNQAERSLINKILEIRELYSYASFGYEIKIKSILLDIFHIIFENGLFEVKYENENPKDSNNLENVISYIHTNYRENITVSGLAKECGYSVSHFTRFFKAITGKSPVEYVNRYKIYVACKILQSTDLSILQVALESGFDNVGYFIKTFSKYTGLTPYKFKKSGLF